MSDLDETSSGIDVKGRRIPWPSLPDLLRAKARERGDGHFCEIDGARLSLARLDLLSDRFAAGLRARGVKAGDTVASVLFNCSEQLIGWFGTMKLGAIWTPLNASLNGSDLMHALTDAAARVVLVEPETWERIERLGSDAVAPFEFFAARGDCPGLPRYDDLLSDAPITEWPVPHPGDPAVIIYSGGTTGLPKGIVLSHFAMVAAGLRYREITGAGPADSHYSTLALFHVGGTQLAIIGPMLSDCTTTLDRRFSVSGYWPRVCEVGATIIDPVGTMKTALVQAKPSPDEGSHDVRFSFGVTGQVPHSVPWDFTARFGIPLVSIYGLTEAGGALLTSERDGMRGGGCVGKPHGWCELRIADAFDNPLPVGMEGEILMRPVVPFTFMTRYHGNPVATEKVLANQWLHTGDIGKLDDEGNLYFIGRQAHWLRHRGENISAHEVEDIISRHADVTEVVIVGVPAELGEEDVKAFIIPRGDTFDPETLIRWCMDEMASYKAPRYVQIVAEFPRSATKREVERAKLKAMENGEVWDREAVMGRVSGQAR